jgi:hypothetical protein
MGQPHDEQLEEIMVLQLMIAIDIYQFDCNKNLKQKFKPFPLCHRLVGSAKPE